MIVKNDDFKVGNYYALESDALTPLGDDENATTYSAIKAGTPFVCVVIHRPFALFMSYTTTEEGVLPLVEAFDLRKNNFILVDKNYFSVYYGVRIEEESDLTGNSTERQLNETVRNSREVEQETHK